MNLVDPKAGTHFTGKIFVSPHACDRAVEHFGIRARESTDVRHGFAAQVFSN